MRARLPETVACVFDAYGTLFDFLSASDRCRDALGDKADALGLLWRTRQLEYSWLRSLMGAHADFWQVTGEALDFVMASLGISNAALRDRLMDLFLRIEAFPDARRVLEALKRAGRPAHILSNGSPAMLESAMKSASVEGLLQGLISVESAGVYKPHRSAYELVTRNLKLPPERICFVSSNGWDAAGAAHFGFLAVWVNRTDAPRENLPGRLAAEIRDLHALPALLGL